MAIAEHTLGLLRAQGFDATQTTQIANHALQTAVMLVMAEPGAETGTPPDKMEAALTAKRAALQALPSEQYPLLSELGANLLECSDIPGYYGFNIDLFVGGVRAMRETVTAG